MSVVFVVISQCSQVVQFSFVSTGGYHYLSFFLYMVLHTVQYISYSVNEMVATTLNRPKKVCLYEVVTYFCL